LEKEFAAWLKKRKYGNEEVEARKQLRSEKEQLRNEKEHLRRKEEQLLEQKTILMKRYAMKECLC